jgi:death on curing protein
VENSGKRITLPTIEEVVEANRLLIEKTGGSFTPPDNLINASSLKWALEIIQHPFIFRKNLYPSLPDKAALLCWTIINDHVFFDGNKRTGMAMMRIMILRNNCQINFSDDEITQMARDITGYRTSGVTREILSVWIEKRIE